MNIKTDLKPALMGAIAGAIVVTVIGFTAGGWMTGGSAKKMAEQSASSAMVAALVPICVNQFQKTIDAPVKQAELVKVNSYDQAAYVQKAGWATMPGSDKSDPVVARTCAGMISGLKY